MKNLQFDDQETAMVYLSVSMFQLDAKDDAPGFMDVLNKIKGKIEEYIKSNPASLDGLMKLIKSEPEFSNHPQARQLLELLNHVVSAAKIIDDLKGDSEQCGLCDGIGNFISGSGLPCPRCGGSGKLNKKETYN